MKTGKPRTNFSKPVKLNGPKFNTSSTTFKKPKAQSAVKSFRQDFCNSNNKDLYGNSWNELSQERKKIDNYTCTRCGYVPEKKNRYQLQADHVLPLSKGGRNTLSNLRTLCTECHSIRHGRKLKNYEITVACKKARFSS